jgi:hypothetical protein
MPCVVRSLVQDGSPGEADDENHESTKKQRSDRASYLALYTWHRPTQLNRFRVHERASAPRCRMMSEQAMRRNRARPAVVSLAFPRAQVDLIEPGASD